MLAFYIFEIMCVLLYTKQFRNHTEYNSARKKLTPSMHYCFLKRENYSSKKATVDQRVFLLKTSVADPDPGSGAFLTPGSGIRNTGWVKNQDPYPDPGSGMNNPDHISESLETMFWVKILKFCDADPGSVMEKFGSGINISDPRCKCKSFSLFSLLCLPPLEALLSIAVHTKALTPPHDTEGMGRKGGGGKR
jgi:hypothetical protein